jgi:hypothetical protein
MTSPLAAPAHARVSSMATADGRIPGEHAVSRRPAPATWAITAARETAPA